MADAAARIAPGSGGRIPVDDASDELGRLATRFNALLDRLDGALDQQRRFLADAAHELRTPLARVRSRVEVALLSSRPSPDDAPSVLPAVNDELIRMSRLVDELLQLARADSGRDAAPAAMPLLYLDDVVTDELHRWHLEAERAGITLQCSVLQESRVRGDAVLLARLVGVFVDNALRYGRRGGSVDVRVIAGDRHVTLEVEDDGIGIAPDEQPRLFERFFRGARARAQRADGSGLGLAIAQWIVRQHLGTIAIAPGSRDTGTLVTVTLPHEGAPTRERSPAPPARHTAAVE
jgi:two-component system OmpR family sensor kinase